MKTRTITMREKIIASAASAALAASMVVCVPGMAFATYDTGSITSTRSSLTVVDGSTTDMSKYFSYTAQGGDGKWHVDYKITSGSGVANVNKHSGVLTATSEGDVTVTAYLTGCEKPQGNSNNPCETTTVSSSIKVTVTETNTYGFQGANGIAIMMTNPSVSSFDGSNAKGWINDLKDVAAAEDGYYYFTVKMNSGFKKYNTAALFADRNAGQISLSTINAETEEVKTFVLASDNAGAVSISTVDDATKTIVVKVDSSVLSDASSLDFLSGFRGNNENNTLGTTVSFAF